jgi:hypothetical protein
MFQVTTAGDAGAMRGSTTTESPGRDGERSPALHAAPAEIGPGA